MHLRKSVKTNTNRVTQKKYTGGFKTGNVKINCLRKQCLKSDPLPCKGFNRFVVLSAESNKFPKFDNSLEEYFFRLPFQDLKRNLFNSASFFVLRLVMLFGNYINQFAREIV